MKKTILIIKLLLGVFLIIFGGLGVIICVFALPSGLLLYIPILAVGLFLCIATKKKLKILKITQDTKNKESILTKPISQIYESKAVLEPKCEIGEEEPTSEPEQKFSLSDEQKLDTTVAIDTENINSPLTNFSYENKPTNTPKVEFPLSFDTEYLYAIFKDVYIAMFNKSNKISIGDTLELTQEPTNEYDSKAIKIICNGIHIGYMSKGKLQKMVHDFNRRNETVMGKIEAITPNPTFSLAFYRKLDSLESFTAPLTRTSKKDSLGSYRYETLESLEIGDTLCLDHSYIDDSYVVTDSNGFEVGELNNLTIEKINEMDNYIFYPRVKEINKTDSGTTKCKVIFYYKESARFNYQKQ